MYFGVGLLGRAALGRSSIASSVMCVAGSARGATDTPLLGTLLATQAVALGNSWRNAS